MLEQLEMRTGETHRHEKIGRPSDADQLLNLRITGAQFFHHSNDLFEINTRIARGCAKMSVGQGQKGSIEARFGDEETSEFSEQRRQKDCLGLDIVRDDGKATLTALLL